MTGIELRDTLSALGCPDAIFETDLFTSVVNFALRRIYNDLEFFSIGSFYAHGITPVSRRNIHHAPGEELTVPVVGKAISMRVSGPFAKIYIATGPSNFSYSIDGYSYVIKELTPSNMAVISLCGDTDYTVYDLCVFDRVFSPRRDEIPDGTDLTSYNILKNHQNFISFAGLPTDAAGNIIEGAMVEGETVSVPADFCGEVYFKYRRRPIAFKTLDEDSQIDLPSNCAELLTLASLAYLYLNIDEDRAQVYDESYRQMMSSLPRCESFIWQPPSPPEAAPVLTAEYKILDGWS